MWVDTRSNKVCSDYSTCSRSVVLKHLMAVCCLPLETCCWHLPVDYLCYCIPINNEKQNINNSWSSSEVWLRWTIEAALLWRKVSSLMIHSKDSPLTPLKLHSSFWHLAPEPLEHSSYWMWLILDLIKSETLIHSSIPISPGDISPYKGF